jgi:hypothetical protein
MIQELILNDLLCLPNTRQNTWLAKVIAVGTYTDNHFLWEIIGTEGITKSNDWIWRSHGIVCPRTGTAQASLNLTTRDASTSGDLSNQHDGNLFCCAGLLRNCW